MANAKYNLPSRSYGELKKIVMGYAQEDKALSLSEASQLTGIPPTGISGSNKFLVDLGVLGAGANKKATELGKKLGRALEHNQDADAKNALGEAVANSELLSKLVSAVRIKGGMDEKSLAAHVLYVSGHKNTQSNRTGARAIVDLLVDGGLIENIDGKFKVSKRVEPISDATLGAEKTADVEVSIDDKALDRGKLKDPKRHAPTVSINISLQLPDTNDAEVYENFFKSMKTHLFPDE